MTSPDPARMEPQLQLAGRLAHDVNNMITAIHGYSELLIERLPADSREQRYASQILRAAQRARGLAEHMLTVSGRRPLGREPVPLNDLVRRAVEARVEGTRVTVTTELDPDLADVAGDDATLLQATEELIQNALDALVEGGTIHIETRLAPNPAPPSPALQPEGPCAVLAVHDDGPGMDLPTLTRACDPFFSTRASAGRQGLGLALVYGVVAQLGGWLRLDSSSDGTTVEVFLPVLPASEADESLGAPPDAPAG